MSRRLSRVEARRLVLAAQGFDRARPSRVTARHLDRVIRRLGLLQIDFVNVLVPAHHLVPFSRLGPYDRARLDRVIYASGRFTEQWAHEASIIPVETWPLLRDRMANHRVRPWGFESFLERHGAYVDGVLNSIRRRGPLTADDLPEADEKQRRTADRWGWGRNTRRAVLEAHFGSGRLAVSERRPSRARVYDLAERVLPREIVRRRVDLHEAHRTLLLHAARAQGVATTGDLADYFRMSVRDVRPRLAELVASGDLIETAVEGWRETAYRHRASRLPRRLDAACLLSPFDPLVWTRPRTARLFAFDYRLEIYVPEAKRRWGYYVLPFLMGDRLAARVDLKADRPGSRLQVKAAYREQHAAVDATADALAFELRTLAAWLGLDDVDVGRRGNLARALAAASRAASDGRPRRDRGGKKKRRRAAGAGTNVGRGAGDTPQRGRTPSPGTAETEPWAVYLVRRGDGALYTGVATDVARRLAEHRNGGSRAARSLRGRGPLTLVLQHTAGARSVALRVEARIKKMPRSDKETLVARPAVLSRLIRSVAREVNEE